MKKIVSILLIISMLTTLFVGCGSKANDKVEKSEVQKIIEQAEQMTLEELYQKAIEESKGKTMYGIGNSSRGATAATGFIEELQKIDPSYDGVIEWSQPKNNSIFTLLNADITSSTHTYSMTLIQDGNQIQSKMINTGNLLNFIPKDWAEANGVNVEADGKPLTLQTLSKVFMFNNLGDKTYTNCWDFVYEGESPLFMGVDSEPVGKNFLYMLTSDKYSTMLKEAFEALDSSKQTYFQKTIDEVAEDAKNLGLTSENAKYGLAYIKLWCERYNEQTDDGPICNELVTNSAVGASGLLVYSKLRSVEESDTVSVNNITVAAYQDDYVGFGGFGYKHYLQVVKTAPLPWTACAFIAYMVTTEDGFYAWGKDMGGYSANPNINQDHSQDGYVDGENKFPAKNDRGYDWWTSAEGGALVLEDPVYCSEVSFNLGDWIDVIIGNKAAAQ
ncbi:hypothetical protein [Herbinix luporum]|uniref:hypothetical protein n=1 Tax=Herbinix luporum TaxID=1679721 RepID=UPI0023F4D83C|nr:hypothetical protein [Herbinix luporum]